jgi:hypothetical protein
VAEVQKHRRWPIAFLMQPIRNPTPILSLSGCSVRIGRIRHRANKQGEAPLVFRDEGVES